MLGIVDNEPYENGEEDGGQGYQDQEGFYSVTPQTTALSGLDTFLLTNKHQVRSFLKYSYLRSAAADTSEVIKHQIETPARRFSVLLEQIDDL